MIEWIKTTGWLLLQRTLKEWSNDDCSRLAAALAYYAVFSIFPLMLLMISLLGFWLRFSGNMEGDAAQEQLLASIGANVSSEFAESLATVLEGVKLGAGLNGVVAFATVLIAASSIFTQLDAAFDRIWNVPQPENTGMFHMVRVALIERGKAFLLVLAIGVLLIGSLVVTTVLNIVGDYVQQLPGGEIGWQFVNLAIAMVLNTLVFALLFYYMPKPKCRWGDIFPAAILTAVLWEIGKQGLSIYLGRSTYTAYATVGAFIILMLWIYYAAHILFFGAEFSQVYSVWRSEQAKEAMGLPAIPPAPDLPFMLLPPSAASAQQKTSYAVAGALLGALLALLLGLIGILLGLMRLLKAGGKSKLQR